MRREELNDLYYSDRRLPERIWLGENPEYGPGYSLCIADYYAFELGDATPNNKLLDVLAKEKNLPRDCIVPVMAGSCLEGEYLFGIINPKDMIRLSADLDLVVCKTAADARALRNEAPILLPHTATQNVIHSLTAYEPSINDWEGGKRRKEALRNLLAEAGGFDIEALSLHLGGDEAIKAIFRGLRANQQAKRIFIPVPNYFDAFAFAQQYDLEVFPSNPEYDSVEKWIEQIKQTRPDIVYISSPNNPLGYTLSIDRLRILLKGVPPETRMVIDAVNYNTNELHHLSSELWRTLQEEFPNHHIIVVDSLSKSHNLVTTRIGMAYATHHEDSELLRKFEPPRFSENASAEVYEAFHNDPIESITRSVIENFYRTLKEINAKFPKQFEYSPSTSNFCVIDFSDIQMRDHFLELIEKLPSSPTFPANTILGLPKVGSGFISNADLNSDGSLRAEALRKKGLLGLPETAVRLSAFSHGDILKALESTFALEK
ncbi:MAG: hypothetical protein A3A33_04550 [Candidatus Yanofskybacteria bacterium RIFCSPLOWO2_01_FULL_49_25]|uniref:Aminotransferase class I/classII large domain-containing protein n=1 Tax=Candidatus Yanofskybacteria bacterium RIFCSPLOWO2_01_FULL_49_25 TaxID=1802701 RepID=A0A1F8GSB1_9BACT|nr:MAG: hypothetical protein A3A33_04550 [Candidatus Yanofskybacteria bacterium RIFCSPLOWO2_01_FULL_49_25]